MDIQNIDEQLDGEFKLANCKHRSEEKIKKIIKRCKCQGGDFEDEGYQCFARKIFKVEVNICKYCSLFEAKN